MCTLIVFIKQIQAMRILLPAVLLVLCTTACAGMQPDFRNDIFDGEQAMLLVSEQLAIGPRIPGSPEIETTRQWIEAKLRTFGWQSERQCFDKKGIEVCNLIAAPVGQAGEGGPGIVFGAHYDTRRTADQDPVYPELPVPGANDGASGVAVLLELARVIQPKNLSSKVTMYFFDAEDQGRLDGWDWSVGASYAAEQLSVKPDMVIIVDMVGDKELQLYLERNSTRELSYEIWTIASELDFTGFVREVKYTIIDDHVPFINLGVPAVEIIDFDYSAWHTTADTLDQVSADSLFQVGRTLQVWLERR